MNLTPANPTDPDFVADAAKYAADLMSFEQLVAKHGGDATVVLHQLSDPAIARAVEARLVADEGDGTLAKAESHALLRRALRHLDKALDDPELGASTVVRIADLAHRVTGMVQTARPLATEDQPRFSVNIIFSNPNDASKPHIVDVLAQEIVHE